MIEGITPNKTKIEEYLNNSLMLVTALTPEIGYEKSAKIAKYAYKKEITLREAALELGFISANDFDKIINPRFMIHKKGHEAPNS